MQISREQLLATAQQGAVILTANKRLARVLQGDFARTMQQQGVSVWPSAQIYPYVSWLNRCLDFLGEGWRLLSPHQQRYLWEEQILQTTTGSLLELMNLERATDTAVQAHNLLTEYGLTLDDAALTEDQELFDRWRQSYQQHCQKLHYLDQGSLARRIVEAFAADLLPLPDQVLVTGFDRLPPGAEALLRQLHDCGVACNQVTLTGEAGEAIRFAARDEEHETECMARWVRQKLESGAERIGVVVPDLARRRSEIERTVRGQIDPASAAEITDAASVFNLSLGTPLAQQGIIDAALTLLDDFSFAGLEHISFLLRTPFVAGGMTEADVKAGFDRRLRILMQDRFRLADLIRLTQTAGDLPLLQQHLQLFERRPRQSLPLEQWAQVFDEELKALGWPGDAILTSTSYQAAGAWYEQLLPALSSLDSLSPVVTRKRALELVRQLAHRLEFQPEGTTETVQVVGLLESAGLSFDHLWVMGMGETVVPAPPQPNPFIPWQLQQRANMPHADYARELEFAEQVLTRLCRAAPDIVLSYPCRSGDMLLAPSRLILPLAPAGEPPFTTPQDVISRINSEPDAAEAWRDADGPALTQDHTGGGTSLLRDQAHCPFRAFVHHRLKVRALDRPQPGIAPGVRGDLVHLSLKGFWLLLGARTRLLHLTEEALRELIASCVTEAINNYFRGKSLPAAPLLQLEEERIAQLLLEWCSEVESSREDFTVIAAEQQQQVQIGSLSLKLVVDRIDRLADGSCVVMDYKTGTQVRVTDLLTDPLLEPQLPLYAVTSDPSAPIQGVVVAKVRRGDCRLQGIVSADGLLHKVKGVASFSQAQQLDIADWGDLATFWRTQLEQLARDFAQGVATVTPYDTTISCRYCDLPGLCRIGALASADPEGDSAGGGHEQ